MSYSAKGSKSKLQCFVTFIKKPSILRTFCVFIIIAVVFSSLISGFIMYYYTTKYTTEAKSDDIKKAVEDINRLYSRMYTSYINNLDGSGNWVSNEGHEEYQRYYLEVLERMVIYHELLNITAFITESDGSIFLSYPLLPNMADLSESSGREFLSSDIIDKLLYQNGDYFFKESAQYYTGSAYDYVINSGDFHGLYSNHKDSYLSITQSIAYVYPGMSEAINKGTITLSIPLPEITNARSSVIRYYVIATIVSVLLETIALIIITKAITNPIRELQKMTEQVSIGNFKGKIKSKTKDELGQLINSYNSMAEALENLDSMRNDFIASVSHELRTPMTSIRGFIDGILDGVIPPEKQNYYLQIVKEEITRMNVLVNDLMNMARLQSGKVELDMLPCKVDDLLYNTAFKLEPIIDEKEINLEFDLSTKNCEVLVDKASIERVLINLIQNATKFTQSGGTITIRSFFSDDDKITVIVEDTGSGISPEELPFIFEKFYKVDKSRGLDKKGTGLGLPIVKSILAAHNQTIKVESVLGSGSRFIFTLPINGKDG